MKELTKAEEQLMQYLWTLDKAFLKDIVEQYPDPKPAYTTISTVVNVLVKKGFVGFKTFGKAREYFPKVAKSNYSKEAFNGILKSFFDNSPSQFASFFTKENKMSVKELEEIQAMINAEIKKQKES
ncbi:MAG: BlaI/MecI/CopY family transcriptional regulator [Cyclobacteriaceae bacterium]